MKLLTEEALIVTSGFNSTLDEATGKEVKNYFIEGIFSSPGQKNRNGRIYSLPLWETQVKKYQKELDENSYNSLGELEHPPRANVDPMKAVIKIEKLYMEEGYVKGRAKILNNNSAETNQIKALIDEGFKIGVSSRGVGRLGSGGIVEDFKLVTFDLVAQPSDYNASLNGVYESEGKLFTEGILEGEEFAICDESGCIIPEETYNKCKMKKVSEDTRDIELDEKEEYFELDNAQENILKEALISKLKEILINK